MIIQGLFIENVHVAAAVSPSSDVYNGNPTAQPFKVSGFEKVVCLLHQKSGGTNTGNAVVKVAAVDNPAGSNAVLIPFRYAKKATGISADTMGAVSTAVAADGFTTTANEDTIYAIEIDAADVPDGQTFVRLQLTESTNDPVLGNAIWLGVNPRYGYPFPTALA